MFFKKMIFLVGISCLLIHDGVYASEIEKIEESNVPSLSTLALSHAVPQLFDIAKSLLPKDSNPRWDDCKHLVQQYLLTNTKVTPALIQDPLEKLTFITAFCQRHKVSGGSQNLDDVEHLVAFDQAAKEKKFFMINTQNEIWPLHASYDPQNYQFQQVTSCQEAIQAFKLFDRISASSRKIVLIAPYVKYFVNLKNVDFSSNAITEISAWIGFLTKLIHLDLSNNQLTTVPVEIGNLQELENLNLSENKLKTVPCKSINSLQKLECLNLNKNDDLEQYPVTYYQILIRGGDVGGAW